MNDAIKTNKSEEEVRLDKLKKLQDLGLDAYPARIKRSHSIEDVLVHFDDLEKKGDHVHIAGRLKSKRGHGGSTFANLADGTGQMQIYLKKDEVGDKQFDLFNELIDIGDFIEASGTLFFTKKGQPTLLVREFKLAGKTLLPLPEKWHGLSDVEIRYRQRYLDLLANDEVKSIFKTRAAVVRYLREFFDRLGFLEVATPILQPLYGGASASPFKTHHNALNTDLYLRIAPELYLKRLIVGGLDKVYEVAKCFRNEGIDREHNPEFTQIEFYQAWSDYNDLMNLTEELFVYILDKIKGSLEIEYEGKKINFTPPFKRVSFRDLLLHEAEFDIEVYTDDEALAREAGSRGVKVEKNWGRGKILDEVYKELVRPKLAGPLFLIDHPVELSPLAKKKPDDPRYVERFQLIIAGREICNAFSELNDPQDQEARFVEQEGLKAKGDSEAQRLDEDYITALKHGLPPTAGWGMGVDRLVAILTGSHNLKEVILFPTLKPKN